MPSALFLKAGLSQCEKEDIKKDWILRKLPLLIPQREIAGGEKKTFIYVLLQ